MNSLAILSTTALAATLFVSRSAHAEGAPPPPEAPAPATSATPGAPRFSIMAGVTQWAVLRGGNLAVEYKTRHVVFEFSHGQGLDLNQAPGFALTSAERDAGARVRVPWTTGFGVGYRITEDLHLLVEAKAHRYNVFNRDGSAEVDYTTFSIGPSVFYSIYLYKGFFIEPNVRFWPNLGSTLSGNRAELRQPDGTVYAHEAHDFGLFANMNLGWTI
jgi:hypothetical protein